MTTHWAYALVLMSLMVLAEVDVSVGASGVRSGGASHSQILGLLYVLNDSMRTIKLKGIFVHVIRNVFSFLSRHENIFHSSCNEGIFHPLSGSDLLISSIT
jgi:hypothetical protein